MVVIAAPGPPGASPPPLFGVLFNLGRKIATLRVERYEWWTLGATCVHEVVDDSHRHLVGKWYMTLSSAAQNVHQTVCGSQTDCMVAVHLYLTPKDKLHVFKLADANSKTLRHDPRAIAHIDTHVHSHPGDVGGGDWLELGKARPFIPWGMPRKEARQSCRWNTTVPPTEAAIDPSASRSIRLPVWERDRDRHSLGASSSGRSDDGGADDERKKKKRRKRPAKIPRVQGACVWMTAMGEPPVGYLIRSIFEDPGDAARPHSTHLYLERLEPNPPPPAWVKLSDVSNFDEELLKIYGEQRMMIEAKGAWKETVAMVKRGLLQRILLLRQQEQVWTAEEVWQERMRMWGEPCPLSEEEATEWLSSQMKPDTEGAEQAAKRRRVEQ